MSSSSQWGLLCDGEFDDGYSFGLFQNTIVVSLCCVFFHSLFVVLRRGQKRSPKKGEREREREVFCLSLFRKKKKKKKKKNVWCCSLSSLSFQRCEKRKKKNTKIIERLLRA